MANATGDNTKRKRPPQTGQLIGVRLQPDQLAALDTWIDRQSDRPSRPEAVRRIMAKELG
jgi:hypothetical protein